MHTSESAFAVAESRSVGLPRFPPARCSLVFLIPRALTHDRNVLRREYRAESSSKSLHKAEYSFASFTRIAWLGTYRIHSLSRVNDAMSENCFHEKNVSMPKVPELQIGESSNISQGSPPAGASSKVLGVAKWKFRESHFLTHSASWMLSMVTSLSPENRFLLLQFVEAICSET